MSKYAEQCSPKIRKPEFLFGVRFWVPFWFPSVDLQQAAAQSQRPQSGSFSPPRGVTSIWGRKGSPGSGLDVWAFGLGQWQAASLGVVLPIRSGSGSFQALFRVPADFYGMMFAFLLLFLPGRGGPNQGKVVESRFPFGFSLKQTWGPSP